MIEAPVDSKVSCAHCSEDCIDEIIHFDNKTFCCVGCKSVYEILSENDLCDYYEVGDPNITVRKTEFGNKYAFLDNEEIESKLYQFSDQDYRIIKLFVPSIHCASCIWLLENMTRLTQGIISSQVNFVKKEVTINFNREDVSLRHLVELMASIGYPPEISLQGIQEEKGKKQARDLAIKMGVAGFCFGNIMLMSFPEYLSFRFQDESFYIQVFAWLNLALSLPVILYCARDYYTSAIAGIKHKNINLDVPISLGITVLFAKSVYDILSGTGPGYLDSMAGLIFFLLIGKWFQNKTYQALSFERDYKSYFPLAVSLIENEKERSILANQLKKGDMVVVRNEELIPADALLIQGKATIDYSFVTGESLPIEKQKGEFLYAGGRQVGEAITVVIQEKVSQSYLTNLWNQKAFQKEEKREFASIIDRVSRYFTLAIITIAVGTGIFWSFSDLALALETFTAVLIIACPCALALSLPFTMGNSIRVMGRQGFYVKNGQTIENLAGITDLVFDKTGTLTTSNKSKALFFGNERLSEKNLQQIAALTKASNHPISRSIHQSIGQVKPLNLVDFEEITGKGIQAKVDGQALKIGNANFTGASDKIGLPHAFIQINGQVLGYYTITSDFRKGIKEVFQAIGQKHVNTHLLSGDHAENQEQTLEYFVKSDQVHFKQSPEDKLNYIESLRSKGASVLMIGDGLNDAGALKSAQVGIALSEDVYSFSPACDAILSADNFKSLNSILDYAKQSMSIVRWSFAFSFLYNLIGLFFAVQGLLTPIVAAILMPLSSISIVVFVSVLTNGIAKKTFA